LQDDELNMHLSQNKDHDRYREARFVGPPSAWRPFERGPRNCIGQELAMIEARLILASVARQYDFAKVGLGEIAMDENGQPAVNSHGQYETKSKLYNVITSLPVPRPAFAFCWLTSSVKDVTGNSKTHRWNENESEAKRKSV
jgi:hypothetical protein